MSVQPGPDGHPPAEQVLVSVGDISCTHHWVVTPSGTCPISGSVWTVTDNTTTTQAIPGWAIVLAIVFAVFCLLGLFFLLIKETRTLGFMQVTVRGNELIHVTQVPIATAAQIVDVEHRVNYIRSLAAAV